MKENIPVFKFALREDLEKEGLKQFLPTKGEPNAVGWDLRAAQPDRKDIILRAGEFKLIPLGVRCLCPEDWWFELRPRSSTFVKKNLDCLYGVIDSDYFFQIFAAVRYSPDINSLGQDLTIKFGDPIFQMIPIKKQDAHIDLISNEELEQLYKSRKVHRTGGFGSTSK